MEVGGHAAVGADQETHARFAQLAELVRERRLPVGDEPVVRERVKPVERMPDIGHDGIGQAEVPRDLGERHRSRTAHHEVGGGVRIGDRRIGKRRMVSEIQIHRTERHAGARLLRADLQVDTLVGLDTDHQNVGIHVGAVGIGRFGRLGRHAALLYVVVPAPICIFEVAVVDVKGPIKHGHYHSHRQDMHDSKAYPNR